MPGSGQYALHSNSNSNISNNSVNADFFSVGDMTIQSQDVDMSLLGWDMIPWFDSFPTHDVDDFSTYRDFHGAAATSLADPGVGGRTDATSHGSGQVGLQREGWR